MNTDRRILRACTAAIVCAVLVRLLGPAVAAADQTRMASFLLFLQTGRVVRQAEMPESAPEETQAPTETCPEKREYLTFTAADAALVQVNDYAGLQPAVAELLTRPLEWSLTGEEPTVLIVHTHGSESYENTEGYTESSEYRTLQEQYNMISVGDRVAELLQAEGIGVLHDRQLHDYPSYNGSYANARESIRAYLQQYPSIRLVLDLHRDAAVDTTGVQVGYCVSTPEGEAAQVMLVVGGGNEAWQENMALAVKLQAGLETLCPGICRPISLRKAVFNQDLLPGAVLIEMGAAGNTRQEALRAAAYVAQVIAITGSTS